MAAEPASPKFGAWVPQGDDKYVIVGDWLTPDEVVEKKPVVIDFKALIDDFLGLKILDKGLKEKLRKKAGDAEKMYEKLVKEQECPLEIARDLCVLVLYDVFILLDDSSSMRENQHGNRIKTVKKILYDVCEVCELARPEGVKALRFLNEPIGKQNLKKKHIKNLDRMTDWNGTTRIGSELKSKIFDKDIFAAERVVKSGIEAIQLVIVITDGEVEGENKNLLMRVLLTCVEDLRKTKGLGEHGVNYQFAYVGNDPGAEELLKRLNAQQELREVVGCLMDTNLDLASKRKEFKWPIVAKLLLGGIYEHWKKMKILGEKIKEDKLHDRTGDIVEDSDVEDIPADS